MNPEHILRIKKASECSALTVANILEAHELANQHDPVLAISLRDLLEQARAVSQGLGELESLFRRECDYSDQVMRSLLGGIAEQQKKYNETAANDQPDRGSE
jgi:hypothetical protein